MEIIRNMKRANAEWAVDRRKKDRDFFKKLSSGQNPEILWIGYADSRVAANEVTRTQPGEIFVHQNIANMVVHTDMSMLSVLDYAVKLPGPGVWESPGSCR